MVFVAPPIVFDQIRNKSKGVRLEILVYAHNRPPISVLRECKDVVVSCVIIEPTYNHEREGRGNFVQEGKSGELASLTQQPAVGGRLSPAAPRQRPTHLYRTVHRSSSLALLVI